jgi:rhodanese-related sulfurtransferase
MEEYWNYMGFLSQGVKNFSAKEAFKLCELGALLLDVREDYLSSFKQFKVNRIIQIPLSILEADFIQLSIDDYIICADSVGLKSIIATKLLMEKGFRRVANLPGGIVDWEKDGFPIEISLKKKLSGSCMCQLRTRERK